MERPLNGTSYSFPYHCMTPAGQPGLASGAPYAPYGAPLMFDPANSNAASTEDIYGRSRLSLQSDPSTCLNNAAAAAAMAAAIYGMPPQQSGTPYHHAAAFGVPSAAFDSHQPQAYLGMAQPPNLSLQQTPRKSLSEGSSGRQAKQDGMISGNRDVPDSMQFAVPGTSSGFYDFNSHPAAESGQHLNATGDGAHICNEPLINVRASAGRTGRPNTEPAGSLANNSGSQYRSHQNGSPMVKRPRGRPRKHPLPIHHSLPPPSAQSLITQPTANFAPAPPCYNVPNQLCREPSAPADRAVSRAGTMSVPTAESRRPSIDVESAIHSSKHAAHYRAAKTRLNGEQIQKELQRLETAAPQIEVFEKYFAYGGPFSFIALAQRASIVDQAVSAEAADICDPPSAALLAQLLRPKNNHTMAVLEKKFSGAPPLNEGTDSKQTCPDLEEGTEQKTTANLADDCQPGGVYLNECAFWGSLDLRTPIRDLVTSRYHIAALLNDGSVYIYRHKSMNLVRSNVARWQRVEALEGVSVVSIRLASANLPPNWRIKYHCTRREALIARTVKFMQSAGLQLPENFCARKDELDNTILTDDELARILDFDPVEGILCCNPSDLDPDWLPDPVVLAALDGTGTVRFCKTSGYYNYPMLVAEDQLDRCDASAPDQSAAENVEPAVPCSSLNPGTVVENVESNRCEDAAPSLRPSRKVLRRKPTILELVERSIDLTVPGKAADGTPVKVRSVVVDLSLGELVEESLSGSEIAAVLYAVSNGSHSAFVKGKGLYIRFKNFPTGPAKMHCGPLGHSGAILLVNGTVWAWTSTPPGNNAATLNIAPPQSHRVNVSISQVGGSLKNKVVVDLMAVGSEYYALTADGVVHEWNARQSYPAHFSSTVNCYATVRPYIPEPIEWTPDFQQKLFDAARCDPESAKREFRVRQWSWYITGQEEHCVNGVSEGTISRNSTETQTTACSTHDESNVSPGDSVHSEHRCSSRSETTDNPKCCGAGKMCDAVTGQSTTVDGAQFVETAMGHPERCTLAPSPRNETGLLTRDTLYKLKQNVSASRLGDDESLERERQAEIERRYKTDSRIERIFVTEGTTIIRRANNDFEVLPNKLAAYRFSPTESTWSITQSELTTGTDVHPCLSFLTPETAKQAAQQACKYGKPLLTNPIVVARMRAATNNAYPTEITANRDRDDQTALRKQLCLMAQQWPPCYRVILAPNSILLAVLHLGDINDSIRNLLKARQPMLMVADDPRRYDEALAGSSIVAAAVAAMNAEMAVVKEILPFEKTAASDEPSFTPEKNDPKIIPPTIVGPHGALDKQIGSSCTDGETTKANENAAHVEIQTGNAQKSTMAVSDSNEAMCVPPQSESVLDNDTNEPGTHGPSRRGRAGRPRGTKTHSTNSSEALTKDVPLHPETHNEDLVTTAELEDPARDIIGAAAGTRKRHRRFSGTTDSDASKKLDDSWHQIVQMFGADAVEEDFGKEGDEDDDDEEPFKPRRRRGKLRKKSVGATKSSRPASGRPRGRPAANSACEVDRSSQSGLSDNSHEKTEFPQIGSICNPQDSFYGVSGELSATVKTQALLGSSNRSMGV